MFIFQRQRSKTPAAHGEEMTFDGGDASDCARHGKVEPVVVLQRGAETKQGQVKMRSSNVSQRLTRGSPFVRDQHQS